MKKKNNYFDSVTTEKYGIPSCTTDRKIGSVRKSMDIYEKYRTFRNTL